MNLIGNQVKDIFAETDQESVSATHKPGRKSAPRFLLIHLASLLELGRFLKHMKKNLYNGQYEAPVSESVELVSEGSIFMISPENGGIDTGEDKGDL